MRQKTKPKFLRSLFGYTLIEILIVLFIISVTACVALLSVGRNDNREMRVFADQLTELITLAQEEAMLRPQVLGLRLEKRVFYFAQYLKQQKKPGWKPINKGALSAHPIPRPFELSMKGNLTAPHQPQIVISSNGDMSPFNLFIAKKGEKPRYVIIGHADGSVTTKSLS